MPGSPTSARTPRPAAPPRILAGLGFAAEEQARPVRLVFRRLAHAGRARRPVVRQPDLLLLDEPTNYLDLEGALWLQDYLARYPHTVILISHDRDLLDSAVGHILHLERGKLTLYSGNYSSFARQRRERQALDLKRAKQQDAERKRIEAFVDRFRAKATKARQAQSRLKLLAKLEPVEPLVDDEVREIAIPSPAKPLSPPIIAFDNVAVGYDEKPVLRRLHLRIDDDDRIALIGQNGNGKSTFAKLLAGRMEPMDGRITRADKLDIAYFAQHQLDELNANESPYDHLRALMPDAPEAACGRGSAPSGFSGDSRRRQGRDAVGRREGAPAARPRHVRTGRTS